MVNLSFTIYDSPFVAILPKEALCIPKVAFYKKKGKMLKGHLNSMMQLGHRVQYLGQMLEDCEVLWTTKGDSKRIMLIGIASKLENAARRLCPREQRDQIKKRRPLLKKRLLAKL